MTKTFGDYLVLILTIIGSFASIIAFGTYFAPLLDTQGWVGVLFLGFIALIFLCYNFYLVLRYRKKVRYAEVFEDINIGFASLHQIDRQNIESKEKIVFRIGELCNAISEVFTKINGHHIRTCIKFLTIHNARPRVITLIRDKKSKVRGGKTGVKDDTDHWLDQNSDFDFIYSNFDDDNVDTSYYYGTRLPIRKNYYNTRLKKWPPEEKLFIVNYVNRIRLWPLQYRCTLVVPIIPLVADEQKKSALRGFLCIDSPRNIAFNKDVDVEILKGISDGLYNKIDKLYQLLKNKNGEKK